MKKSEFSETQFVVAFLREALSNRTWMHFPFHPWIWTMPSTVEEAESASDFILRNLHRHYTHSIFYQFKRSYFYNQEVFKDLNQGITIDTSVNNYYGFKVYNKSNTQQFNKLQQLARQPNNEVFYCAPLFYTRDDCITHFRNNTILKNSKVIDFKDNSIQNVTIPLDSNHTLIFNRQDNYISSKIKKVNGFIAEEKLKSLDKKYADKEITNIKISSFENVIAQIKELLADDEIIDNEKMINNVFYIREKLMISLNMLWIPYFDLNR